MNAKMNCRAAGSHAFGSKLSLFFRGGQGFCYGFVIHRAAKGAA